MSEAFLYAHPADAVAGTPSAEAGTPVTGYEPVYATDWSDANAQRPALFTETTGVRLKVAFGGNQRMDLIVVETNLDTGVAFDIRTGSTYAGATQTAPLAGLARRDDGYTYKQWVDLRAVAGYSASGFPNLWFNVSGTNSVGIGVKLWIASIVRSLEEHFSLESLHLEDDAPTSIVLPTDAGAVWGYNLATNPRLFKGQRQAMGSADIDRLRAWHRASGGRALKSPMIPDTTRQDAWIVRWLNATARDSQGIVKSLFEPATIDFDGDVQVAVALEEITAGLPEWS